MELRYKTLSESLIHTDFPVQSQAPYRAGRMKKLNHNPRLQGVNSNGGQAENLNILQIQINPVESTEAGIPMELFHRVKTKKY